MIVLVVCDPKPFLNRSTNNKLIIIFITNDVLHCLLKRHNAFRN